jgi:hypothetical protein
MIDVYFMHSMTIALAPGEAVECRGGEIMALPDELANKLLKRRPDQVSRVLGQHSDARRRTMEACVLGKELAAVIAPAHDEFAIIAAADKASKLATAKRFLASSADVNA